MAAIMQCSSQSSADRSTVRHDFSPSCRATRLWEEKIDFIPNSEFAAGGQDHDPIVEATLQAAVDSTSGPAELPAHLRHLCEQEVLTQEQERALFREMNQLKYRADAVRSSLDPKSVLEDELETIEGLLARARVIRDHIIKANMRLAISVVKKFVTPQRSFDDLLSDGIVTLMHAVEKFDFDRGFRFSTYAYRSIARQAYRSNVTAHKEEARFTRDAEEWAFEQEGEVNLSLLSEQVWGNLRDLTATMLDRLDRRERFIIRSRYAWGSHRKVRTFQYLADKLGISKERARQLEIRAVAKLRGMANEFEADELFSAALA